MVALIAIILVSISDNVSAQVIKGGVIIRGPFGIRKKKNPEKCFPMLCPCNPKKKTPVVVSMDDSGDAGGDWGDEGGEEAKASLSVGEGIFVINPTQENLFRITILSNLPEENKNDTYLDFNEEEDIIIDDETVSLLGFNYIKFKSGRYEIKTDGKGRKYIEVEVSEKN